MNIYLSDRVINFNTYWDLNKASGFLRGPSIEIVQEHKVIDRILFSTKDGCDKAFSLICRGIKEDAHFVDCINWTVQVRSTLVKSGQGYQGCQGAQGFQGSSEESKIIMV
jgi:hypothetical protein